MTSVRPDRDWIRLVLVVVSAALVALGRALGWRGVDMAAQVYRVQLFRAHGFLLWDSQWYGGHWTLDYSVAYPALAALGGIGLLAVISAAVSTAAFDHLVVSCFGPTARLGSAVFAVGVVVETSIGQLPFFTAEALGLACLCCLGSRRHSAAAGIAAVVLAVSTTLTSPLAGAFLALCAAAVALSAVPGRQRRLPLTRAVAVAVGVVVGALAPIVVTTLLFPGDGDMPYPFGDWLFEVFLAVAVAWSGRRVPVIVLGTAVYVAAMTVSVIVPTALGGNVGRLEDAVGLPLFVAAGTAAGVARTSATRLRRLRKFPGPWPAAVLATVLALSQWSPAWAAISSDAARPASSAAYYAPVAKWLDGVDRAGTEQYGRVEIVPTHDHWESAYLAPDFPLARGWERQLDIADNELFYGHAPLSGARYLGWLRDVGVRFVAVPDAPLDAAGESERSLIANGVSGLREVWRSAHWKGYEVAGGSISSAPLRVVSMRGPTVVLAAARPGTAIVRLRWSGHWRVKSGHARVLRAGAWIYVVASRGGRVVLGVTVAKL